MKKRLNKRIIFLIGINIIFLIAGLLYPSLLDKSIISTKLTSYIEGLHNQSITINQLIKTNLLNNTLENIFIYFFTYFIFTFPITIFIYILKIFTVGISISSIFYIYKIKGLLYLIITVFPTFLNLIVLSISFYYSLTYFIIRIRFKKKVPKKRLLKSYFKVFIITLLLQIIISFIDSYMSFYFFKFIS